MATADTKTDETEVIDASGEPPAPGGARGSGMLGDLVERARERGKEILRSRTTWIWVSLVVVVLVGFFVAGISLANVLVIGLQTGAVFSLIALGLALVFKATRVLNFAQGALGSAPTFIAYVIMVGSFGADIRAEVDASRLWWASIVAVLFAVALALLINLLVVQRLAQASGVTALVATVGVALFVVASQVIIFEAQARPFPRYIEGEWFSVGNTPVTWHTVIVVVVLVGAAVALALFFRTPLGVALLATAQEPFAAELSGISVRTMSMLAWALAGALGAVGGLLGAGVFENITPGFMLSRFLIPAFVGAVLGGLTSMVGAVVGGLLLGLATSFANEASLAIDALNDVPGPPWIATLLILVAVLLFRPRGLFGEEA